MRPFVVAAQKRIGAVDFGDRMPLMFLEIWTFIRRHGVHALLCVPGAILVTLLHEAAHALAAWAQGGRLLEFVWLPWVAEGKWGYVSYDFPAGVEYSGFAIAVAPYVLWLMLAAAACLLSMRRRPWSYGLASTFFFWLYFVPLADIANAAFPWLAGKENDFAQAFGPATQVGGVLVGLLSLLAILIGYGVQRGLYASARLSLGAYAVLVLAAGAAVCGVMCLGIPEF